MGKNKKNKSKLKSWLKKLSVVQQALIIVAMVFFGILTFWVLVVFPGIPILKAVGRNNSIFDFSGRQFKIEHFNGYNSDHRVLTCSNGQEIFYQDDTNIKSYSDGKSIAKIENTYEVSSIAASKNYLYVVESGKLCGYSLKNGEKWTYPGLYNRIDNVFVYGEQIYFNDEESNLYFFQDDVGIGQIKSFDKDVFEPKIFLEDEVGQYSQTENDSNVLVCKCADAEDGNRWYFVTPTDTRSFYTGKYGTAKIFKYNNQYIYMKEENYIKQA